MRSRSILFAGLLVTELMLPITSVAQSWNQIAQFSGMGRVSACYFFDESTGIIGFDQVQNGSPLLRTTDGGMTWNAVATPIVSVEWTCDIWFRNALEGWATFLNRNSGGYLWHSTDGGLSWASTGQSGLCTGVRATSKALVVTQYDGPIGILISTDGGNTFPSSFGISQNGIDFVDDLHGVASTYASLSPFAFTSDGGLNWQPAVSPYDESWTVLGLSGTSTFLVSSEVANVILRSTDFGVSWNVIANFPQGLDGSLAVNNGTIYTQSTTNGLYSSTDIGKTWVGIGGPSNGLDCKIAAFSCVIYAFDADGGVWKSSSGNPVDSVQFLLRTLPSVIPGQHFNVDVLPDRSVNANKGLTSVSGRIGYFRNDFVFDSMTSTEGFQFQSSKPFTNNGMEHVDFSIANSNGISLDPQTPIAQLWLESMLTDSIHYTITLDSVLLNNGDPSFSNCTLATSAFGVSPQLQLLCGDSILINSMLGHALFSASPPIPNPLSRGSDPNGVAQINMKASANGEATIDMYNALGKIMSSERYSLKNGQPMLCPINLQGSPAGSYFYTIRFSSSDGIAIGEGSILVVQ